MRTGAIAFLACAIAGAEQGAGDFLQAVSTIYDPQDATVPKSLGKASPVAPVAYFDAIAVGSDGGVWVGGVRGLLRNEPNPGNPRRPWRYFASRRYLPDDQVMAMVPDASGGMWVRTETGVAHIELRPFSLVQKAEYFETRIQMRHDRYGMVSPSELAVPGQLASSRTRSDDNDGLWTAMYGAAECFRYAATKSAESLERARRATRAVLFLEHVTGRPGFPARSYIRTGEPRPADGEWHRTADGACEWKGDTSSDEIVGHFFLYSLAYDLLPDEALRKEIRGAAARIMDHILTNRYELVDVSGKPTTWGRWSPEYFATPEGRPDAPLNAVELLSFLCVSHHLTGDEAYLREYRKLTGELHYPEIAARYSELREELNYSDEELAILSFYPLLQYETDPALLTRYRAALDQWWANMRREENPLWTFIYLACNPAAAVDTAAALETLRNIPLDLVSWTVSNSHRRDIEWAPGLDRFGKREAATLLPADERPVMKWNGDPFVVDGGDGGRSEDDGTFFLLPYWMGRHLKFVPGY